MTDGDSDDWAAREAEFDDDHDDHDQDGDDDHGDGDETRSGPTAAYAVNWKTVIAVDATMGLIVVAAGFVAIVVWNLVLGAALCALGLFYVAMVLRRGRAWQQLRREAGL